MSEPADVAVDVVVIGGGISGLAAAHSALNAGASVLLLEGGAETGGVMQTETNEGFLVECGPTSLASSQHTIRLLNSLGLSSETVSPSAAAKRRYVVRNGAMHALPSSLPALLRSSLLTMRGKARLFAEPLVARPRSGEDEALAKLVRRRFGQEVLDYVVDPFVSGVCAGDATRLSKRFTLRTLDAFEQEYRSIMLGAVKRANRTPGTASSEIVSLRRGMRQLPDALTRAISTAERGALRTNARVTSVSRTAAGWEVRHATIGGRSVVDAAAIVCALPAHALGSVSWPAAWADSLARMCGVRYAPISTVALGFDRSHVQHPLDGFGVLIPSVEKRRILGALFNSSMFADRAPAGQCLVTAFVGGSRVSAAPSLREAINAAVFELTPLLGLTRPPVMTRVTRWETGIPQLEVGHESVQAAAEAIQRGSSDAFFTGSYVSGVAIGDCLEHGATAGARAAASALRGRAGQGMILARIG